MNWKQILKLALPEEYAALAAKYNGSGTIARSGVMMIDFLDPDDAVLFEKYVRELLQDQRKGYTLQAIDRAGYKRIILDVR